jgi:gamma-glutamyltranspeptidase/glutathione hydrolase
LQSGAKRNQMATPQLQFTSRRSPVLCTHGVCCTSQPLASEAGLSILKAGGNAADAAVAAVAALNVTEACMCGLGGDAFCLYYDAATKTVKGLNGSGRAPQALTPERARAVASGANRLPAESVHCVTVPGAAACWADCVKDFGRLPLADVLAPAIEMSEEGVPIHAIAAQLWSDNAHQLLRWGGLEGNPGAASLLVDGRPPQHGEVLRNPELAATLRTLASQGAEGFYKGAVAEAIVQCVRAKGGVLSLEDLAAHATERVSPISTTFRGKVVHELPPNGSGLVALMALATLEELTPSSGRPEDVLCQVEALRMAFAKGLTSIGDGAPASVDAHLSEAKAVAAALENLGTDTTYLCCVDAAGNACSFICSNFEAFGSGLVPEGCGFSLQKLVLCGNEISGAPPHAIDATLSLVASDRWRGGSRR